MELACKNASVRPLFTNIAEMLFCLFYIYKKSPKKSYDLSNIVYHLRCVLEFPKGAHLPVRSHGTRWIIHKRKARHGAYVHHISTLIEDRSLKLDDRQRFETTLKSVKALKSMATAEWPHVKLLKSKLKELVIRSNILQDFDRILEQCKKHVTDDIHRLELNIKEWLINGQGNSCICRTQTWQECFSASEGIGGHHDATGKLESNDFVEVRTAVDLIVSTFCIPLEAALSQFKMKLKMYLTRGSTSR